MSVIVILSIIFAVVYGVLAYLFKKSLVKNSSIIDSDKRKLQRLIAFCFQFFVVGYPASVLIIPVGIVWIKTLLSVVMFASIGLAVVATSRIQKNESFVEVCRAKDAPTFLAVIGVITGVLFCITLGVNMFSALNPLAIGILATLSCDWVVFCIFRKSN